MDKNKQTRHEKEDQQKLVALCPASCFSLRAMCSPTVASISRHGNVRRTELRRQASVSTQQALGEVVHRRAAVSRPDIAEKIRKLIHCPVKCELYLSSMEFANDIIQALQDVLVPPLRRRRGSWSYRVRSTPSATCSLLEVPIRLN